MTQALIKLQQAALDDAFVFQVHTHAHARAHTHSACALQTDDKPDTRAIARATHA